MIKGGKEGRPGINLNTFFFFLRCVLQRYDNKVINMSVTLRVLVLMKTEKDEMIN